MKNIKIITIHCIPNFGSIFQTFGLVSFLTKCGYNVETIDYRPKYFVLGRNPVKRIVGIIFNYLNYISQIKKYNTFITKNLHLTEKKFKTFQQLETNFKNDKSIFIAGGDQLWNNYHFCGKDDSYKLLFTNSANKIAFGTSLGRNNFSSNDLIELSEKVKNFNSIGLREYSTVNQLSTYCKTNIYHAADPVLLLDKSDYLGIINTKRQINEDYLLMYLADKSDILNKTVSEIARSKGLKIVHVCGFRKKCDCDYFLKNTGPTELLNLLIHAKYIVSASFHATLFSILFEKNFCTLLPGINTNTRIEDLLSFVNLEYRIVKELIDIPRILEQIDYSNITPTIKNFSKISQNKLLDQIKNMQTS